MFSLSSKPLPPSLLQVGPASGASVSFEGIVRCENEGKPVKALQYEAMEELACKEGQRILEEAISMFGIHAAACRHRVGLLQIGEPAIFIQVVAGHRGEAFDACRYIIDEVKRRVPIWKKEFYETGESGWINADGTLR